MTVGNSSCGPPWGVAVGGVCVVGKLQRRKLERPHSSRKGLANLV